MSVYYYCKNYQTKMRCYLLQALFLIFLTVSLLITYLYTQGSTSQDMLPKALVEFLHREREETSSLTTERLPVTSTGMPTVCKERRHIVFIKVHKAGSSTIANILFRFGMARNLTFLMPDKAVTVALRLSEPWTNIMPLPAPASHYDMLSNHAVYEKKEIDRLFPRDRVVIAILRHPMGQLESAIYFYYSNAIKGEDKAGEYLAHPERLTKGARYVNNSMAYELGVPKHQFFNMSFVRSHVQQISQEIEFVLIMEKMAESLILMKRRLCWSLKDVIFIIRNVNTKKPHFKRTESELQKLRKMMKANFVVHEFFQKRLEDEILLAPHIEEEVTHFKQILKVVSKFCLETDDEQTLTIPPSIWNEDFVVTRHDCEILQLGGVQILQYAKRYQYGKV